MPRRCGSDLVSHPKLMAGERLGNGCSRREILALDAQAALTVTPCRWSGILNKEA